jgi:hypothetical protein
MIRRYFFHETQALLLPLLGNARIWRQEKVETRSQDTKSVAHATREFDAFLHTVRHNTDFFRFMALHTNTATLDPNRGIGNAKAFVSWILT